MSSSCSASGFWYPAKKPYSLQPGLSPVVYLSDQFGHDVEGLGLHGGEHHGRRRRALPRLDELGDALLGATQGDLVDQVVGHGRRRLLLLTVEIEILDLLGCCLVAVAAGQVVVEVAAAGSHAADVQSEHGLDHLATG